MITRIAPSRELLDFFRHEFLREEASGFSVVSRVPDSRVMANLAFYRTLNQQDREAFADCCAHWAHACYGFVIGAPEFDHTQHPFFTRWLSVLRSDFVRSRKSVPLLRTAVAQYKIDAQRGVPSCVPKEEFEYASSVRSMKAPELKKRVRAALKPLGYYRMDDLGYYCCRQEGREFRVGVDYGGKFAQLRYVVVRPEFKEQHPLLQFKYERALGLGDGDWDIIVEENVDDVFLLFGEIVRRSYELPDRILAELR